MRGTTEAPDPGPFRPLYPIGRSLLGRWAGDLSSPDREDILQDAIAAYLERLRKHASIIRDAHGYFSGIVRYRLNRFLAQRDKRAAHSGAEETLGVSAEPDPPEELAAAEIRVLLRGCVAELEPVDQRIIALRFFEEQTFQEVSRRVKLDKAQVHRRLNKALQRLRRCLGRNTT